jgi:hypothetical protein
VIGANGLSTQVLAAQAVIDLVSYRELFSADRPRQDLRPWGGATASAVAGMSRGRKENKTTPVPRRGGRKYSPDEVNTVYASRAGLSLFVRAVGLGGMVSRFVSTGVGIQLTKFSAVQVSTGRQCL